MQNQELIFSSEVQVEKNGCTSALMLKKGIWLYFLLIIFEGSLRKWIFPGLATPLLVVRDPIAIWLVYMAWKRKLLPANIYMGLMICIGLLSIYTSLLFGHGNLPVAIYGARIMLIHFPLMFVIGQVFDQNDVLQVGKIMVYLSIPMVILIGFQFYSPQSAWVNRGVGGDTDGAGFSGAMGFFRPPGTFSFTIGNAFFFSFLTPFIFYFWLEFKHINKFVLCLATIALLFAIPLSISRTLLFQISITILFVLISLIIKPDYILKLILAMIGVAGALFLLSDLNFFSTATEAFTSRFENANQTEGGLEGVFLDRFLGGLIGAITNSNQLPFWGYGTGMGTNVGSMLLTGETTFLIAEAEWGRVVGELGILLGFGVILIRLCIIMKLTIASFLQAIDGDVLPWLLMSFGFLSILQSQWAQPTILGFSTLIGGLIIASFNSAKRR